MKLKVVPPPIMSSAEALAAIRAANKNVPLTEHRFRAAFRSDRAHAPKPRRFCGSVFGWSPEDVVRVSLALGMKPPRFAAEPPEAA